MELVADVRFRPQSGAVLDSIQPIFRIALRFLNAAHFVAGGIKSDRETSLQFAFILSEVRGVHVDSGCDGHDWRSSD